MASDGEWGGGVEVDYIINKNDHLRLNIHILTAESRAMASMGMAVARPKNPAAPRLAAKFLETITKPLASAKSAILHIANQTITTKAST